MAFSFPWFINGNRVSMATRRSCIVCAASICTFIITCIICIFGSPTISANDSMRMITSWICSSTMTMWRQFSDSALVGTLPHKHSNVRLHVIVWHIRTSIFDISSMGMITSIFGIDAICSRTIGVSYTVRSFFVIVAIYSMFMIASWRYRYIMPVTRQFPDRLLCCSTPTINRYIRLQVIVWIIRASVTNSYGMSMCTSLFGCFCALIRTPWSWSRFCTTCVVFFYKSKSMRVIPACTNRYIVVMFRQFSDSSQDTLCHMKTEI